MDDELVTRNHRLTSKGITAIPEIFSSPYYQDEAGYAYEYRPVPIATFAIEHSLFGDNVFIGHLANCLLYAFLCYGLFKLLIVIGGVVTPFVALCITLLFCAHPSHSEVVCSIKNRDEILGLLFCLLSCWVGIVGARKKAGGIFLQRLFFFLWPCYVKNIFAVCLLHTISCNFFYRSQAYFCFYSNNTPNACYVCEFGRNSTVV